MVAVVYCASNERGHVKIGFSNNWRTRLCALFGAEAQRELQVIVLDCATEKEARAVEAYAHWLLRDRRVVSMPGREWFLVDIDLAKNTAEQALTCVRNGLQIPVDETVKLSFHIPIDTHEELKVLAARRRQKIGALVEGLIDAELARQK